MKPTPVEENEILLKNKEIDETKEEFVENFNKYSCVTPKTRLIIVGTITPPDGMNNGYFYTAPHNSVYRLIDESKSTNLKRLKKSLSKETTPEKKEAVVTQIKNVLEENGIAFLDIMKYAIRQLNKSDDDVIKYYCIDIERFKNIPNSVYFICNSKLAKEGYLNICKALHREPNYIYLPQNFPHLYRNGNEEKWIEIIKKYSI